VGRWDRYWFAPGGRTTVAVLRIAIAISVLMSLWRLWHLPPFVAPEGVYRPVGVWMLLGRTPPPDVLVGALWVLAWAGTVAMLVGFCSRAATAVSFAASVSLAALSFSGNLHWSHQYNVTFLAQLALLGARCGDTLSVDALVRRLRGRPARDVPRGYQWSVRLVLLAVSMMFVGAAFHKIATGQFTLRWALSDNLRNQLLIRYDMVGIPRPAIVDWLLEDVWRYRTAALLNLVSQLAPLFAVVFVRRPLVRALGGVMYVIEVLALGFVMSLWNWPWLLLAVVYVDWDWLVGRVTRIVRRTQPAAIAVDEAKPAEAAPSRPSRAVRIFVIAFFVYDLAISLIPTLDRRLNTYPFTSFPMFSTVRAARPYDQHLPYGIAGDHYELISDIAPDPDVQRWFDYQNRNLHMVSDPVKVRARLEALLERAKERYGVLGIRGLRHYTTLFVAPAYPAPARLDAYPLAITGEIMADGTYRSLLGKVTSRGVELGPQGLDASAARLVYFADDRPDPIPLTGTRTGDRIAAELAADPVYVAAELPDGRRWLVGWRRTWRWE
jgi:hypothetical protein